MIGRAQVEKYSRHIGCRHPRSQRTGELLPTAAGALSKVILIQAFAGGIFTIVGGRLTGEAFFEAREF
jgi:hypothetical protein